MSQVSGRFGSSEFPYFSQTRPLITTCLSTSVSKIVHLCVSLLRLGMRFSYSRGSPSLLEGCRDTLKLLLQKNTAVASRYSCQLTKIMPKRPLNSSLTLRAFLVICPGWSYAWNITGVSRTSNSLYITIRSSAGRLRNANGMLRSLPGCRVSYANKGLITFELTSRNSSALWLGVVGTA